MSATRTEGGHPARRPGMSRRQAIERTVLGGGALALFSGVTDTHAQSSATGGPFRMRRVVTGHTPAGRSTVISDDYVSVGRVWSTTDLEQLGTRPSGEPNKIMPADRPSSNAPQGGSRVILVTFEPPKGEPPTVKNRIDMHTTNTIDYQYVLTGAVWCILDEKEVLLKAGDIIIQRNTSHSWRMEGTEPCRMMTTQVALRSA